jgi:hypothetical protein
MIDARTQEKMEVRKYTTILVNIDNEDNSFWKRAKRTFV